MNTSLFRRPLALLPLAMSAAALAMVIGFAVMFGTENQSGPGADEQAPARIFQLLIAGQLPLIAFFALRWLPAEPRAALMVLALQFAAALAAVFPVWWFQW